MTYAAGNTIIDRLDKRRAFPISADATTRHRSETVEPRQVTVNLWRSRKVIPSRKTYGIEVGMTIQTWYGPVKVTRVGTIAGWGMRLDSQREVRWEASHVIEVPAPEVADRVRV